MDALKDNAKKCDEAIDYLKDELSAFSNEPLLSPKKKHIYDHMKGVASVSIVDRCKEIQGLVLKVESPINKFDAFLRKKREEHKDDWTDLYKKSLAKHSNYVEREKSELQNIRGRFDRYEIEKYVANVLEHCKQALPKL